MEYFCSRVTVDVSKYKYQPLYLMLRAHGSKQSYARHHSDQESRSVEGQVGDLEAPFLDPEGCQSVKDLAVEVIEVCLATLLTLDGPYRQCTNAYRRLATCRCCLVELVLGI